MTKIHSDQQRYLDDLFKNDEEGFEFVMRRREDLLTADKPSNQATAQAIGEYESDRILLEH